MNIMQPEQIDDLIRRLIGLSRERLDAYEPVKAVTKIGKKWVIHTVRGNQFPLAFATRREAVEQAERHQKLMEEQYANPRAYNSLETLMATEQLRATKNLERRLGRPLSAHEFNESIAACDRDWGYEEAT